MAMDVHKKTVWDFCLNLRLFNDLLLFQAMSLQQRIYLPISLSLSLYGALGPELSIDCLNFEACRVA